MKRCGVFLGVLFYVLLNAEPVIFASPCIHVIFFLLHVTFRVQKKNMVPRSVFHSRSESC